ncbi:MAG: hypothetical protein GX855_07385 [Firmicutes bacterium]|nr:hypothetical protein [Bacillota bacterium]
MQDELLLEEELQDEEMYPTVEGEGIGRFYRRMLIKILLIWGILLLLSFEYYLLEEKQILSHPVEAFVEETELAVHFLMAGATAKLRPVTSFAELKPLVIRAGRLMGISPHQGILDARLTDAGRVLIWTAADEKGRQHTITGFIGEDGSVSLDIQTTYWGVDAKIKDTSRELYLAASCFGKVTATRLEVEGTVVCQRNDNPEKWVQQWRLRDLEVTRMGSAVRLRGVTSDLATRRGQEVPFTLSFVPTGETRGRLTLSVGT